MHIINTRTHTIYVCVCVFMYMCVHLYTQCILYSIIYCNTTVYYKLSCLFKTSGGIFCTHSKQMKIHLLAHIYFTRDDLVPLVKSWCLKAPQRPSLITFITRSASSTDCIIFWPGRRSGTSEASFKLDTNTQLVTEREMAHQHNFRAIRNHFYLLLYFKCSSIYSHRSRFPPGSCRRQLTIPTTPQWAREAVNQSVESEGSAIISCSTDQRTVQWSTDVFVVCGLRSAHLSKTNKKKKNRCETYL